MDEKAGSSPVPKALLGMLFLLWLCLGVWICRSAPFASGTDESIRYVAFAAAKNRWATQADFMRYGIDTYYYPPLYFLLFAPFYGDNPSFSDSYPREGFPDTNYVFRGGLYFVPRDWLARIPADLDGLYRSAKFLSLTCGVAVLVCLVSALAILFTGAGRWWLVLGGTVPCLLLPQFLYYHTLCNNDPLVNALSAGAILAFIGAWRAAADRRRRRFLVLSLASAAALGLGLLTKQSAACLLPLLPCLAAFHYLAFGPGRPGRLRGSLGLLGLLAATATAFGGWWTIAEVLRGDASAAAAQRLSHPWAFRDVLLPNLTWASDVTMKLARSYIALFTGDIFGIPDLVFLSYLAVAALLALFMAAALPSALRRFHPPAPPARDRVPMDRVLWFGLAAVFTLNLLLVYWYNLTIRGSYGRFLFPTLLASHVLLARGIAFGSRGRARPAAAVSLSMAAGFLCLLLWVFRYRMVQAVTQPPERLVSITSEYGSLQQEKVALGPVWNLNASQPFFLQRGTLSGLRVKVVRSQFPLIGAVLRARLKVHDPGGRESAIYEFEPSPVGDNDATQRWTDLKLPAPLPVSKVTLASLEITASRPFLLSRIMPVDYAVVATRLFQGALPASLNGSETGISLCLTAVYTDL